MNHEKLEEMMQAMVENLLRNAHFFPQSSGLLLADVLAFRYKVSELLPLVGREYHQLPKFLAKNKAIINVQNTDNRCFAYPIISALAQLKINRNRHKTYKLLFETLIVDKIRYQVQKGFISTIEDGLPISINIY